MKVTTQCEHCGGTGRKLLTPPLAETLRDIKYHPFTTCAQIAERLGDVTNEAVNNRASELLRLGFVTRHKRGKFYHYRATEVKK